MKHLVQTHVCSWLRKLVALPTDCTDTWPREGCVAVTTVVFCGGSRGSRELWWRQARAGNPRCLPFEMFRRRPDLFVLVSKSCLNLFAKERPVSIVPGIVLQLSTPYIRLRTFRYRLAHPQEIATTAASFGNATGFISLLVLYDISISCPRSEQCSPRFTGVLFSGRVPVFPVCPSDWIIIETITENALWNAVWDTALKLTEGAKCPKNIEYTKIFDKPGTRNYLKALRRAQEYLKTQGIRRKFLKKSSTWNV